MNPMRYMAFDIGEKRIGIAISDSNESIATALKVLPAQEVIDNSKNFKQLIEDWEPDSLVFGLPKTLSGEEGPQAARIKKVAQKVVSFTNLPYEFVDERLSSKEAKGFMREQGMSEKDMRGKIDMVAAQIFLQAFLDKKRLDTGN